jgi:hypothetical protein
MISILVENDRLVRKLNEFRRHPDWLRAFNAVLASGQFLSPLPDGRRGIFEKDFPGLTEAVDQQFVDDIARATPKEPK